MNQGFSLHIGLNYIDASHYGSDGALRGCENDAKDLAVIATACGFKPAVLLNEKATSENVSNSISSIAAHAAAGDFFLLTYSGHGSQVKDTNGDEDDVKDETWCLFDRQFVDDELYSLWALFKPGVRIFVLSDSCHSGTVIKVLNYEEALANDFGDNPAYDGVRTIPYGQSELVYQRSKDLYDRVQVRNPKGNRANVAASVILMSGCQDWQLSADGPKNGYFTATLLEVWNDGAFQGSNLQLHQDIANRMPSYQKPNYLKLGTPNSDFDNQRPFDLHA